MEYVAESLRQFGWKQPIVIDKDGVIVAGSVLFVLYGALIGAYSNIILNSILVVIHIVKLRRMRR